MTKEKLAAPTFRNWSNARKPFDLIPSCDNCITMHARYVCLRHPALSKAVRKVLDVDGDYPSTGWLRAHYRQIVALRRKFKECWE
jgi:hypothetical protein